MGARHLRFLIASDNLPKSCCCERGIKKCIAEICCNQKRRNQFTSHTHSERGLFSGNNCEANTEQVVTPHSFVRSEFIENENMMRRASDAEPRRANSGLLSSLLDTPVSIALDASAPHTFLRHHHSASAIAQCHRDNRIQIRPQIFQVFTYAQRTESHEIHSLL